MINVGAFLKDERGSQADQAVIKQVIELSNKASKSYDDFNMVIKEPNFIEKLMLKLSSAARSSHAQKVQKSAVTNYKLLVELKNSCESWLDMLKNAMGQITGSIVSDSDHTTILEKYIIAGYLAKEEVEKKLKELELKYDETGREEDAQEFQMLKQGYDLFNIVLGNLEKTRVTYKLSMAQLALIQRSNVNVQVSIHTQMNNSMALLGQQLRNAVLDAKNREVLEGQQAITRLNDELIKEVSKSASLTAEQTEKLLYNGIYNVDAARQAIATVMNGCQVIQKTAEEMLPKMHAEVSELNTLIDELEPYVVEIKQKNVVLNSGKSEKNIQRSTSKDLKF